MIKIFFDDRPFIISSDEAECFSAMNGIGTRINEPVEACKLFDMFEQSPQIPEMRVCYGDIRKVLAEIEAYNKFVKAAGGVVFNDYGRLLLIYRLGFWDMPKGKAEKGETREETALREVQEECGISDLVIKRKVTDTYHVYRQGDKRMLKETTWYEMRCAGHEPLVPQTTEDIEKAIWADVNDLHKYDKMYASIKEVLNSL